MDILLNNKVLILRIGFLYFFARELYLTTFKRNQDKYIWFLLVAAFGFYGYSFFLAYKRRLVLKRKFQPKFKNRKSTI